VEERKGGGEMEEDGRMVGKGRESGLGEGERRIRKGGGKMGKKERKLGNEEMEMG
jgi:hypothetical protein